MNEMPDYEKVDRATCVEACGCIHSALISGNRDCIYGDDYYEKRLDFWDDLLEPDDESIEIVSPEEFDAVFDFNGVQIGGTWRRIIHTIFSNIIVFNSEFEKDFDIYILTNGSRRIMFHGREIISMSTCPINPECVFYDATNMKFKDIANNYMDTYLNDKEKYVQARHDCLPTDNMLIAKYCEYCDEGFPEDEEGYYEEKRGYWICDNCYFEYYHSCVVCGDSFHGDDLRDFEGNHYCEDCYSDEIGYCDGCDEDYKHDDLTYDDETGYSYCEDCYDELLEERKKKKETEKKDE